MNFREALDEMKAGKTVARAEWREDPSPAVKFIYMANEGELQPQFAGAFPDFEGGRTLGMMVSHGDYLPYPFVAPDVAADDWIVVGSLS